jgi:hypothetical protein
VIETTDRTTLLGYIIDNVASQTPQVQDAEESLPRDATAQKNVVDGEETTLKQLDGCNLEVAAYSTVHGGEKFD